MKGSMSIAVAAKAFGSPSGPKNLELIFVPKNKVAIKSKNKEEMGIILGIFSLTKEERTKKTSR